VAERDAEEYAEFIELGLSVINEDDVLVDTKDKPHHILCREMAKLLLSDRYRFTKLVGLYGGDPRDVIRMVSSLVVDIDPIDLSKMVDKTIKKDISSGKISAQYYCNRFSPCGRDQVIRAMIDVADEYEIRFDYIAVDSNPAETRRLLKFIFGHAYRIIKVCLTCEVKGGLSGFRVVIADRFGKEYQDLVPPRVRNYFSYISDNFNNVNLVTVHDDPTASASSPTK
jgi:hypothetical protein